MRRARDAHGVETDDLARPVPPDHLAEWNEADEDRRLKVLFCLIRSLSWFPRREADAEKGQQRQGRPCCQILVSLRGTTILDRALYSGTEVPLQPKGRPTWGFILRRASARPWCGGTAIF